MDWLERESKENWHAWRKKHIGASEIAAVMGESEFRSAYDLWREKIGEKEPFKGNFATERGQQAEPLIREAMGIEPWGDGTSITWKDWDVLSCTPDGMGSEGEPVEIKYLSEAKWQAIKENDPFSIPRMYYLQVQQQLLCTENENAIFLAVSQSVHPSAIDSSSVKRVQIPKDLRCVEQLIEHARAFWAKVESKRWEDAGVSEAELCAMLEEIDTHKMAIEEHELRIQKLRDRVSAQIDEHGKELVGWIVRWKERKGSIDYAKVPELKGVDLEPFRKSPVRYLDVRRKAE